MKKIIINEGQRGFLFQNGKFVKMLTAGKYHAFGGRQIYVTNIGDGRVSVGDFDPQIFLIDKEFAKETTCVESKSGTLVLHFVNGSYCERLPAGKYYFWTVGREHNFVCADLSQPEFSEEFPEYLFSSPILMPYVLNIEVSEKQKAVLFYDKKFERLLDAGTYHFVKGAVRVEAVTVDTCSIQQDIVGQEILTADKVPLRVSCTCSYRIEDCVKVITEIDDYRAQLHTAVQLALRDYIGENRFDDLLSGRNELSAYLFSRVKEKAQELYLNLSEIAVKDLVLPGEIRDIMNTVLVAEKRAQANVIARREEVASTRSLLNTARLMDENATLYKLKELEYVERICEKVGNINLNGGGDILTQLTAALGGKTSKE